MRDAGQHNTLHVAKNLLEAFAALRRRRRQL